MAKDLKPVDEPMMSLASLGGGAAEEMFGEALQKVLTSIDDPNHPAKKARVLTLTVTMTPLTEDRTVASTQIQVDVKVPKRHGHKTTMYLAYDSKAKRYVAQEHDPKQAQMFQATSTEVLPRIPDDTHDDDEKVS
jgi:hypothetical protein